MDQLSLLVPVDSQRKIYLLGRYEFDKSCLYDLNLEGIQQYASESLVSSNLKEALAFFGVLFTIIHDTQTLCVIGI